MEPDLEERLMNQKLVKAFFRRRGKAYCVFCWYKFTSEPSGLYCSNVGYITLDGKYWICEKCCEELKERFNWEIL